MCKGRQSRRTHSQKPLGVISPPIHQHRVSFETQASSTEQGPTIKSLGEKMLTRAIIGVDRPPCSEALALRCEIIGETANERRSLLLCWAPFWQGWVLDFIGLCMLRRSIVCETRLTPDTYESRCLHNAVGMVFRLLSMRRLHPVCLAEVPGSCTPKHNPPAARRSIGCHVWS